jgi:hypothetical protein
MSTFVLLVSVGVAGRRSPSSARDWAGTQAGALADAEDAFGGVETTPLLAAGWSRCC